ncbi:TRAP transporter small permease [Salipiger sp. 1_MG-2023]|uniref:TRAP transporter small permease n=1 Tax=Salipiger sp. 1_MG-2023 TaxID=3062665 RepID=UPI0026E27C76|nr:TRAP transporter small permease [Salipiger sp. 1_MG-2023]MDO6587400.1 TRAP transporter small permease [Salipiger sp. 1_MG-2023]
MQSLNSLKQGFETLLEVITAAIVAALTILIVCGTVFRYAGSPLVWYDEIASVGLVWMTYFGSALAALKGAHIGFPGIVNALPPNLRVLATVFSEICVFLFFGLMAYAGMEVLIILEGMTLVTLPGVSVQLTQAIIPLGAVLFMLAEALRLPEVMRDARGDGFVDHEVREALAELEADPEDSPGRKHPHDAPRLGEVS